MSENQVLDPGLADDVVRIGASAKRGLANEVLSLGQEVRSIYDSAGQSFMHRSLIQHVKDTKTLARL